jgi:hypothetical protein
MSASGKLHRSAERYNEWRQWAVAKLCKVRFLRTAVISA